MEGTGEPGQIHITRQTAELIISHGRRAWIKKRSDNVHAKGKGTLQTYWLTTKAAHRASSNHSGPPSVATSENSSVDWMTGPTPENDDKMHRLVGYCSDLMVDLLKKIHAKRQVDSNVTHSSPRAVKKMEEATSEARPCVDEVGMD